MLSAIIKSFTATRFLLPNGKIYFVEMKSPHGRIRPIQKYIFEKFEMLGFKVHVLNSEKSIEKFVGELVNDERNFSCKTLSRLCNKKNY